MNTQSKGILPPGDCEERLRRAGKRAAAERDTKRAGAVVGAASDSLDIVEVKARLGSSASDLHDEQVPSDTASIGATFGRIGCDVVGDCHIPNIESLRVQLLRGEPEVQDVPRVVTEEHQGSSAVVGIDDNGSDLRGGWGREDVSAHSAVRHPGSYPPGEGWVMARPPADNNRNLLRGTDGRPDHTAVHLLDICGKMGFPFRCRELIESDAALARAAGAAPRPGWAGAAAHRARAVALAGSVRPCATSGRSPAGRRLPVAAACGTAARGCASAAG